MITGGVGDHAERTPKGGIGELRGEPETDSLYVSANGDAIDGCRPLPDLLRHLGAESGFPLDAVEVHPIPDGPLLRPDRRRCQENRTNG
jgi:hypothetical protein